ncbi:prepilin-type N-terminal cleavage/methylation domain-containing protein [Deinococcus knuensis]|uniref:Prepilin-type N-terminal cleavage/methylation domain-containing protein n=1 Tax=Deinococcus knuensis TaxID=1837380 RepID=A0ABQ2STF2_9DEIO|nr:prepilin-type N-terminal cleavage/methylation domain-containing protein [Deinococcus knuensis]GGS39837.1 hypothetical protein GCM10008961_33970 [Deinococcus knuensis]
MNGRSGFPARRAGFTLFELLVVMAVVGILTGIAAVNVSNLRQPADEVARMLASTLGFSRARAIATTAAVRVQRRAGERSFVLASASSCAALTGWTEWPDRTLTLPTDVQFSRDPGTWTVCFSGRGVLPGGSAAPDVLTFVDRRSRTRSLQVYAGGAVVVR